jgi:hypothetical protein
MPSCFGSLTALTFLYLSDNKMTGTIPVSFGAVKDAGDDGMVPVHALMYKYKPVRAVNDPNDDGMVPVNDLLYKYKPFR